MLQDLANRYRKQPENSDTLEYDEYFTSEPTITDIDVDQLTKLRLYKTVN